MTDPYQERYLEHRASKHAMLACQDTAEDLSGPGHPDVFCMMRSRRSVRRFSSAVVSESVLLDILQVARLAPTSCNRQALVIKVARGPQIHNLLAGGEGWLGAAPVVLLVFADFYAYKSVVEKSFMPWLDSGVMLATLAYAGAAAGLGCCIVNPHIRAESHLAFSKAFNPEYRLFCGAVALGYPSIAPEMPEKKPLADLVEWLW